MYDSIEEINQKLSQTVLIYKNKPVFVVGAYSDSVIQVYYLTDSTRTSLLIPLDDPELNYRNLGNKLGYLQIKGYGGYDYNECTYSMRQPVRKSQGTQGLGPTNVHIFSLKGSSRLDLPPTSSIGFGRTFMEQRALAIEDMLKGEYLNIQIIANDFLHDETLVSKAFDRKWAIERDWVGPFSLMYKNTKVGYTEDFHRFVVAERYKFLKPDLKELKVA